MEKSKYIDIARYLSSGSFSQRDIAGMTHTSKNKVSIIKEVMEKNKWIPEDLDQFDSSQLDKIFRRSDIPQSDGPKQVLYVEPDYDQLCKELLKPGVTKKLLFDEYAESCKRANLPHLQKTQFQLHLEEHLTKKSYSEVIRHEPGREIEVDWTGDPAYWKDPYTGEIQKAWLFAAILPFSGYAYAEVFPDMKLPNWIKANVHMLEYFHGSPHVIICDNLKTGVIRHPKNGDVIYQADYEAFANYYGIILEAAKVRAPRYKAHVENVVGKFESAILGRLRNIQCFSIEEYNKYVRKELDEFNAKPFQKKEGSRLSLYTGYEKDRLSPLPSIQYEYFTRKKAKIYPNICFQYNKNFYSVPYQHIGEEVWLRIFSDRIECWTMKGDFICTHKIKAGIGKYDIWDEHRPPNSASFGKWNSNRFLKWAKEIGPYTYEVVDRFFRNGGAEQRYYNTVLSILKLTDTYPRPRVEHACQIALDHYKRPVYKNIKAILYAGQDMAVIQPDTGEAISDGTQEKSFVRGAEYYAKKNKKK